VRATIHISLLGIVIRNLWQHAVITGLAISDPRCLRRIIPLSLPGHRLILAAVIHQVFLHLLLCHFYLILYVVVSFIYVSNLLKAFQLLIVLSCARVVTLYGISPEVPINHMKVALLAEIYGVDAALPLAHAVKDVLLDVFAHVLNDGTLPLHGCGLLIFGLLAQFVKGRANVKEVPASGVLGGLPIHLVEVDGADLVKLWVLLRWEMQLLTLCWLNNAMLRLLSDVMHGIIIFKVVLNH